MTVSATFLPPLERSKPMRFLTVFLFYVTQGFPLGLFFYAIPAYMASSGATTGEIASVVGLSNLPSWRLPRFPRGHSDVVDPQVPQGAGVAPLQD